MKSHSARGFEILSKIDVAPELALGAGYHHERLDGKGYPRGLKGEEIPLSARIMAVADVFDALLSRRSYKEPLPFDKAISIVKNESGTHFDPLVVAAFLNTADFLREALEYILTDGR